MKLQQKNEQSPLETSVLDIINNVNKKFTVGRQEYLLLMKRQKDKDYCTLYITDCESKFWIKKIDSDFLQSLKQSMSINTELHLFTKHFANNIKENSKLFIDHQCARIQIELKIGEGLLMACNFKVESTICLEESLQDFRVILKMFLKQLFEAKEWQIEEERKKSQKMDEIQKFKDDKAVPGYVKQVLHGMKKDASEVKPKNRSLLNPNNKRRKQLGVKFQADIPL